MSESKRKKKRSKKRTSRKESAKRTKVFHIPVVDQHGVLLSRANKSNWKLQRVLVPPYPVDVLRVYRMPIPTPERNASDFFPDKSRVWASFDDLEKESPERQLLEFLRCGFVLGDNGQPVQITGGVDKVVVVFGPAALRHVAETLCGNQPVSVWPNGLGQVACLHVQPNWHGVPPYFETKYVKNTKLSSSPVQLIDALAVARVLHSTDLPGVVTSIHNTLHCPGLPVWFYETISSSDDWLLAFPYETACDVVVISPPWNETTLRPRQLAKLRGCQRSNTPTLTVVTSTDLEDKGDTNNLFVSNVERLLGQTDISSIFTVSACQCQRVECRHPYGQCFYEPPSALRCGHMICAQCSTQTRFVCPMPECAPVEAQVLSHRVVPRTIHPPPPRSFQRVDQRPEDIVDAFKSSGGNPLQSPVVHIIPGGGYRVG